MDTEEILRPRRKTGCGQRGLIMVNLEKQNAAAWVQEAFFRVADVTFGANRQLWELAELSGQEFCSATLLTKILKEKNFSVRMPVCGFPTAFVASYGTGHPVIGLLGEYDALPGLSQEAGLPEKRSAEGSTNGHGCGHCALGSGSLAAALMLREYLEEHNLPGTIRYYGCCSEETDGVKPHMASAGEFDDVDCVFAWHPGGETGVPNNTLLAMQAMTVTFTGSHDHVRGTNPARSACELMNIGINYLREHVNADARMHYAYLDAEGRHLGKIPQMSLAYSIRAPKLAQVKEILTRVQDCAEGAALMTDTKVKITLGSCYADRFQNSVVAQILSDAALEVGPPQWEEADFTLASRFTAHYDENQRKGMEAVICRRYPGHSVAEIAAKPLDTVVEPFNPMVCKHGFASSDVGDVGYVTPTASMRVACSALGNPAHSWFLTGMIASSIGQKGIACAAKILALAAIRVYETPALLNGAQEERMKIIGGVEETAGT